jgi:hydroxymethylglutaryl-CoA reductase
MSVYHSRIPGFYRLSVSDRVRSVAKLRGLSWRTVAAAFASGGLEVETADSMVENALGLLGLPFGVALNFRVNGRYYLVPMAVEEPSVIAAASHAAKRALGGGGFVARSTEPLMVAQVELEGVDDAAADCERLGAARGELLRRADAAMPRMVARGGGARDIELRDLGDGLLVVHFVVDCQDAMGANLLNTVAEAVGPRVAEIAGARLGLRILSNYCDQRRTVATVELPLSTLGREPGEGAEVAEAIVRASRFAERDPYRAVTHNKGIMNGVDAVVVATGNDWRAVEASAHAFAARSGRYQPLATWALGVDGKTLCGRLELPLGLGIVGGALRAHLGARLALRLLGVESAGELAEVAACAGLATNLSALRALGTSGIQSCHMPLHHRATALVAGRKRGAA